MRVCHKPTLNWMAILSRTWVDIEDEMPDDRPCRALSPPVALNSEAGLATMCCAGGASAGTLIWHV
jgi:hypothetical protein